MSVNHNRLFVESYYKADIDNPPGRYLGIIGREPEGRFRIIAGHPTDPSWVAARLAQEIEKYPLRPWQAALVVQLVEVIDENIPEEG